MPRSKKNKRAAGNAGPETAAPGQLDQASEGMDDPGVEECGNEVMEDPSNIVSDPSPEHGGKCQDFVISALNSFITLT